MPQPPPEPNRPPRNDAGFTLLEVLAAVAVAGVLLSAIGGVVAVTMAGIRSAPDRVTLAAAGRTLLASLPQGEALRPGTTTGALGDIRYQIVVTPAAGLVPIQPSRDGTPPPNWRSATVTITATTPRGRALRLDTVRLMHPAAS